MAKGEPTWQLGWQGITVDVPVSWSLSKVEGTEATGYLRLDDETMPRLELRWGPSSGKKTDLEALCEQYLKQVRKMARKHRTPFEYAYRNKSFPAKGREVRYLTLKSDYPSHIIVSRCKQCGRVVLARILHSPGEELGALVGSVFGSLHDHARQGEATWSVFDLSFRLPEAFKLAASAFQVGRITLAFKRRKDVLVVERHNFAREVKGTSSLKSWLVQGLRRELRPFACSSETSSIHGHEGLILQGRLKLWRQVATLGLRGRQLRALAWECSESDRAYMLRLIDRRGDEGAVLECARSLQCHRLSG